MKDKQTIKEQFKELQPYEKFLKYGVKHLSDAELLAIIIKSGSDDETSVELAARILNGNDDKTAILNIVRYKYDDLIKFKGIGKVKAIQIKAIAELSERITKSKAWTGLCFNKPETIAMYYMPTLRFEDREHVIIMLLNNAGFLIRDFELSLGTANSSCLSPREIFIEALKDKANQIIMVHNHPSGNPFPSKADLDTTELVKNSGNLIGIPLADHIIIGDNKFVSLKTIGKL
ncbi:MAG: DNA repair protein RadC [Lachnospiraceae bacterium]|nr:DNA repair protein RadC [Lachnospiraceae bacterium]